MKKKFTSEINEEGEVPRKKENGILFFVIFYMDLFLKRPRLIIHYSQVFKNFILDTLGALNYVFEWWQKKYRACFSNSTSCRPPNVNLALLRNALFRSKVLDSCAVATAEDLLSLLEKANTKLMNRPQESWPLINKARALAKARYLESDIFIAA